ncbi:hypothetical protein C8R42DRAFT_648973 [Lentinula raphanica]|nr:hypothetical protein C8R42DRAFT_648973 [Lentinula raphanica]
MPKALTPKTKRTPKTPSKAARVKQYTADILSELHALRRTVGYPANEPSCNEPALQPGEFIAKCQLYHGVSHNVDGPLHNKFESLGRFMWVIKRPGQKEARFVVEPNRIPFEKLVANQNLLSLLMLRAELTLPNSTPSKKKAAVPKPSQAPFPLAVDQQDTNAEEEEGTTLIGSEPVSDSEIEFIDPSSDDEIEIIDTPKRHSPPVVSRVTRAAYLNGVPGEGRSDEMTVIAWTKDNAPPCSKLVVLSRGAGSYLSLAMLIPELQDLGLMEGMKLERFIWGKGWRQITWNTIFPVGETRLIVLKLATVKKVQDWDIQLEHLYN